MGRNKNRDNRSAARRKQPPLQGGSKPSSASRKDLGVPAYFKQRRQVERDQQYVGNQDGKAAIDIAGSSLDLPNILGSLASSDPVEDHEARFEDQRFQRAGRDLALSGKRDSSVKAFMRDMKNVIDNSDVILQVLDARDPQGSRSRQTERLAMSEGKKLVLVLNKVDLIPTSNLQAWLRYLRNDFPTLAFKASTQQQRSHLKQGRGQMDIPQASTSAKMSFGSEAVGANALLQLLKNYARTAVKGSSVKQQLTVGVVGSPNVGKSSLINSLLRTRACAVASTPGWTKVIQGVMLEKGIRLLDCPGVALNAGAADGNSAEGLSSDDAAWNMLRNTVKVELIEDPIAPIQAMLKKVDAPQLIKLYNIEGGYNEGDAHDFLLRVALLRGKLSKGGIPDLEGAARIVLHDWNIGRISFFTVPPAVHSSLSKASVLNVGDEVTDEHSAALANSTDAALTVGSSLLSSFGEAFDLAGLFGEADAEAMGINETSSKGSFRGKSLVEPRERVYASEIVEAVGQEIDLDEDESVKEVTTADNTHSTLGKRRRGLDDIMESSGDEESDMDAVESGTDIVEEGDDLFDKIAPHGAHELNSATTNGKPSTKNALSRRQRELQTTFSEQELASMAQKRGDVRKAAKKQQKRLRKSGANLVDAWASGMDLQGDPVSEGGAPLNKRGMFDLSAHRMFAEKGATEAEEEEL